MVKPIQPAEWAPHRAVITAWPEHEYAWGDALSQAQDEFESFIRALCNDADEEVWLLCFPESHGRRRLADLCPKLTFVDIPYGDTWLRDIAPVFVGEGNRAVRFNFNGWGGKYIYPHDADVSGALAERLGLSATLMPIVTEGGALEPDGEGTYLTTRCCLINDNRNPGLTEAQAEALLGEHMGAERVIWLDAGLANDHTDGHIDNIARFVSPGEVLCMAPCGDDDPNREVLLSIERALRGSSDAAGRALTVHTLPSPGAVRDEDGELLAASYMNFYIGNRAVIVPGYDPESDAVAVSHLQRLFPSRKVLSLPARAILTGGGSFHCVTQQVPATFTAPVFR